MSLTLSAILLSGTAMADEVRPEGNTSDVDTTPTVVETVKEKAPHKMDKAEFKKKMEERRIQFAKRLNLTEEQQKKAEELQAQNKDEMKKIMEEIKVLREKADSLREKSKTEFEALLTPEQKETLKQMHEERKEKQKERMEKRKGKQKGFGKGHHKGPRGEKGPKPMSE